jgi:hypothetical protein
MTGSNRANLVVEQVKRLHRCVHLHKYKTARSQLDCQPNVQVFQHEYLESSPDVLAACIANCIIIEVERLERFVLLKQNITKGELGADFGLT